MVITELGVSPPFVCIQRDYIPCYVVLFVKDSVTLLSSFPLARYFDQILQTTTPTTPCFDREADGAALLQLQQDLHFMIMSLAALIFHANRFMFLIPQKSYYTSPRCFFMTLLLSEWD